jgi:DNA-binding LytR/AlgR family response regulator
MTDDKSMITLMSLKSFLEKLPAADFQRVHRRYIVALHKIKTIGTKKIMLENNVEIPVGDTYLQVLHEIKEKH